MNVVKEAEPANLVDNVDGPGSSGQGEQETQRYDSIALRIASEIQPSTALHVGCGAGSLVDLLRQAGSDAFGISTSEQAVAIIPAELQPFCSVCSPIEPLPQRYDLIICLDGLKGLAPGQANQAIERLCQHSDDVLFSPPSGIPTVKHIGEGTSEYWAELFARNGFFRDLDFDASFAGPQAARFRRALDPARAVASYERQLRLLERESQARRALNISQRNELMAKEHAIQVFDELQNTPGWAVMQRLQYLRLRLTPPGSRREQVLEEIFRAYRVRGGQAPLYFVRRAGQAISWRFNAFLSRIRVTAGSRLRNVTLQIDKVETKPPFHAHQAQVEIIICVHNALADTQRCLESVVRHTIAPYSMILVDDGSEAETRDYLAEFAATRGATLLRNEEPRRYTRAANQGLAHSSADYVVLLNSDTIVTPEWLDRMIACAESDPKIGMVGPLSNTASWQSIPQVEMAGDWAPNALPPGMTSEEMARLVARYSDRIYPKMPFLNGFCLLLQREMIQQVGLFDEEAFGEGYGEEDDYALRARKAGWQLALADDAYVYHAQSRSYSSKARKQLSERAGKILARKHGQKKIADGVRICSKGRILEGIRFRSRTMLERQEWINRGKSRFYGRRVLFVLPIAAPGGGGNVVIDEGQAMREMGVDVQIFNLKIYQSGFERAYPGLDIPVVYGHEEQFAHISERYDAVVATHNTSVEWLTRIDRPLGRPVCGYYIQGFEPYMYTAGTEEYQGALSSYTLLPELVRFTKTDWTRQEVESKTGAESTVVGPSVNTDLFRPRPRLDPEWPDRPTRIAAMIRPCAPYREPRLTMELFRQAAERYHMDVEAILFGTSLDDPGFAALPRNFAWKLAGVLSQKQVARLMNEVDIFVDFSSHQAMGLTAMEAMSCGVAVIVPQEGGTDSFARHEENCLVVNTASEETCWRALRRLIDDDGLRQRLQRNAARDICHHYPERPAFNILSALFD